MSDDIEFDADAFLDFYYSGGDGCCDDYDPVLADIVVAMLPRSVKVHRAQVHRPDGQQGSTS